mmetsp:Transcript_98706/g.257296  ORF Transcript_98706/g.257296 Transcript_98706/m.257296 type:complete len:296 (-) Transcript_98706:24-911(-)
MGWRAILKGPHEKAKLSLRILLRESKNFENLFLKRAIENSHRTATYFNPIDHHVIRIGTDVTKLGVLLVEPCHRFNVVGPWRSERMMFCNKTLIILIPFQHGEIDHPKSTIALLAQAKLGAHDVAEFAHGFLCLELWPRKHTEKIAGPTSTWLLRRFGHPHFVLVVREKLLCRAIEGTILVDFHPDEGATSAFLAGRFLLKFLDFLSGPFTHALEGHTDYVLRIVEEFEVEPLCAVGDVNQLHVVPPVRLVNAEAVHGFTVFHALERRELMTHDFLENVADQTFEHAQDVILRDE